MLLCKQTAVVGGGVLLAGYVRNVMDATAAEMTATTTAVFLKYTSSSVFRRAKKWL